MKMPWVKLWRGVLQDEKISFLIARYGHEVCTLWIALLTNCEDGILELDEDILASLCHIEDKRYQELRDVFLTRGLVIETDGRLEIPNWQEYQVGESTERVRRFRERRRPALASEPSPQETATEQAESATKEAPPDETLQKREGNAEGTGDIEGDIEGDGEGDARAREVGQPEVKPGATLVLHWYRRFAEVTKINVEHLSGAALDRDIHRAGELLDSVCVHSESQAMIVVDAYFVRWRSLWFAVTADTRKLPEAERRPDFAFASFCAHYIEVAAQMAVAPPGPSGGLSPSWSTSRVNRQELQLTDEERAELEDKLRAYRSTSRGRALAGVAGGTG